MFMKKISIATLGTAHGDPTAERFNSSTLLELSDGTGILIDAGTPVLALLIRKGFDLHRLRHIFITHMHEDHTGGLPDILKFLAKRMTGDAHCTIHLPEISAVPAINAFINTSHRPVDNLRSSFAELTAGSKDFGNFKLTAIPTAHASNERLSFPSFALLFEADGKKLLFSGDLAKDLRDYPAGVAADIYFMEITHYRFENALPLLAKSDFKQVVFNHVGNEWHGKEAEKLFAEMSAGLPFPCYLAHDGEEFTV